MTYKKKTWIEKLEDEDKKKKYPKFLTFDPTFPCGPALTKMGAKKGDKVVITLPTEVDEIMKKVPKGKVITLKEISRKLAKKHNVDYCCTLTGGFFVTTAANAAKEYEKKGKKRITPYWRTLKMNGYLNEKYPGGLEAHRKLLEKEGFNIVKKGKNKYFVQDFEKYLVT
ncbi:MGMT family protein [Patescibacteria group bacterium]|nr:MGMT family protein [Patescibacteria group bacterium]